MTTTRTMAARTELAPPPDAGLTTVARAGALAAGVLATVSLVGVLAGEIGQGTDFMGTAAAELMGWTGFAAACALLLGIAGLGPALTSSGQRSAWAVLLVATGAMTGGTATLALVVPAIVDVAPDLATDPPVGVPATFILSGLVMGVSAIVLAVGLRRTVPELPRWAYTLLVVGAVVTIVPLPSRFFLLAFGIAAVLGHLARPVRGAAAAPGA